MTHPRPQYPKRIEGLAWILVSALLAVACARQPAPLDVQVLQDKYGVHNASTQIVQTPDGPMEATMVPVTMADGKSGYLLIPRRQQDYDYPVYIRDGDGLHPVILSGGEVTRDDFIRSQPVVGQHRVVQETAPRKKKRSFEKEALIVGGSAAAGAAIGGIAGGGKGAGIGALSGGIAGLVYDLATRKKN